MLTAIELHAPGAFDPDQFACWSLRRPCGGQGERRRHIGLVPIELSTELRATLPTATHAVLPAEAERSEMA
jgi:hypothetical protein